MLRMQLSPGDVGGTGTAAAGTSGQGAGGAGTAGTGGQAGAQQGVDQQPPKEQTFEEWLAKQPKESQDRFSAREKSWKATQATERADRETLRTELMALRAKAEKGSDLEKQLGSSLAKIEETDRKADFYEAAHAAGVANLKLAYVVAVQDDLFDKKGNVSFETLKGKYPELFAGKAPAPKGNAGAGTGGEGRPAVGLNEIIRRASGRR